MMKRGFVFVVLLVLVLGIVAPVNLEEELLNQGFMKQENTDGTSSYIYNSEGTEGISKIVGENTFNLMSEDEAGHPTFIKLDDKGNLIAFDGKLNEPMDFKIPEGGEVHLEKGSVSYNQGENILSGKSQAILKVPKGSKVTKNPSSTIIEARDTDGTVTLSNENILQKGGIYYDEDGKEFIRGKSTKINNIEIAGKTEESLTENCQNPEGCTGIYVEERELKISTSKKIEFHPDNKYHSVAENGKVSIETTNKVTLDNLKEIPTITATGNGVTTYTNGDVEIIYDGTKTNIKRVGGVKSTDSNFNTENSQVQIRKGGSEVVALNMEEGKNPTITRNDRVSYIDKIPETIAKRVPKSIQQVYLERIEETNRKIENTKSEFMKARLKKYLVNQEERLVAVGGSYSKKKVNYLFALFQN